MQNKKLSFTLKLSQTFQKKLIKASHLKNAIEMGTDKTAPHPLNLAVRMILTTSLSMVGKKLRLYLDGFYFSVREE